MYSKQTGDVNLEGEVCLVTGASKGIGKGIAVQLAYFGAKCYITGRNKDTLEEINREVKELGGSGECIPMQCDHVKDDEVLQVFDKIAADNGGRLDLLVNNAYSAVKFVFENLNTNFWEQPIEAWDEINNVGLRNHYRCSVLASKLMVERRAGLIINLSSPGGLSYLFSAPYGIGKAAKDRMAQDCGYELKKFGVAYISLWPMTVKTEYMENESAGDGMAKRLYKTSQQRAETPTFVGKTVAALLSGIPRSPVAQFTLTRLFSIKSAIYPQYPLVAMEIVNGKINEGSFTPVFTYAAAKLASNDNYITAFRQHKTKGSHDFKLSTTITSPVHSYLETHPQIMKKTGKIILTSQLARDHGITDEYGMVPPSLEQLNYVLRRSGYLKLASYVPDWIRLPFWLLAAAEAVRKNA